MAYIDQIKTKDGNLYDVKDSALTEIVENDMVSKESLTDGSIKQIFIGNPATNTEIELVSNDSNRSICIGGGTGTDLSASVSSNNFNMNYSDNYLIMNNTEIVLENTYNNKASLRIGEEVATLEAAKEINLNAKTIKMNNIPFIPQDNCVFTNNGIQGGTVNLAIKQLNVDMSGLYLIYLEYDSDTMLILYHPNNMTGIILGTSGDGSNKFKNFQYGDTHIKFTADVNGDTFAVSVIQLAKYIDNY